MLDVTRPSVAGVMGLAVSFLRASSGLRRSPAAGLLIAAATVLAGVVSVAGSELPTGSSGASSHPMVATGSLPSAVPAVVVSDAPTPEVPQGTSAPGATPDEPGGTAFPSGVGPSATPGLPAPCPEAPAEVAVAPVVRHGSRHEKVVALTFDDGWGATTTRKILAILERARANATFFPVGRAIERDPVTWRAVAAAGFPIGDHTYDHRDLVGLCYPAQLAEITRQQLLVTDVLGVVPLPVVRPPYGAFDAVTRLAASGAGEGDVVLWDVDSRDWAGLGPGAITANALGGEDGSIVLMHTFVANTAAVLPRIIAGYRARGFELVTIGQLLGIGGAVPFP